MYKNDRLKPYTAAIIFTLLTGFSFLGIKACQPYANQLEILTYRYNFAFLAVVIVWFTNVFKSNIKNGKTKGKSKKMVLLAASSYILFMILQVIGIFYTTSVVGSILFSIIPIIVQIIAAIVLKEKSTTKQIFFVVITVVSLIYMIIAGSDELEFNILGVICLLLASIFMAVSNISMRYLRDDYKPIDITLYICIIGFILFNTLSIVMGVKNGNLDEYFLPLKNSTFILEQHI